MLKLLGLAVFGGGMWFGILYFPELIVGLILAMIFGRCMLELVKVFL